VSPAREDEWGFAWEVSEAPRTSAHEITPRQLEPGQVFAGAYRIESVLGRGGMGTVFRAHDLRVDRAVALKVLQRRAEPSRLARLRREGELTANLRHVGIVRIHAAGDVSGLPWLAYELVEGARTLDVAIAPLDRNERIRILRDVATAVGYAHREGVVHRDLKSDNVLVDISGRPQVIDFGLAFHDDLEALSKTGAVIGTPRVMAPEQFAGNREAVGPATDVWALGILLYGALTDEHPFQAETWLELAARVTLARPETPREADPSVPPELDAVCMACLQARPEDRYADARLLALDLEAWLEGRAVSAASAWSLSGRRARRGVSFVLGGLLLVLALTLALWPRGPGPDAQARELLLQLAEGHAPARDGLEGLLEAGAETDASRLGPQVRADVHLALAAGEGGDEGTWRARLRHARAAGEEAPRVSSRRQAECLLALDRPLEAVKLLERVAELPRGGTAEGDDSYWATRARAELEAGQFEASLASLDHLQRDRYRRAAQPLRVRALLGAGKRDEARAGLEGLDLLDAQLTRARLAAGEGDVEAILRTASARRSPEALGALAKHLLRVDALPQARAALKVGPRSLRAAGAFLGAVDEGSSEDAAALVGRTLGWRRPVLRYLLRGVRREFAFRRTTADHPTRNQRYTRRAEALLALAQALVEADLPEAHQLEALQRELGQPPLPPDPAVRKAAAEKFAEVLAAKGRHELTHETGEARFGEVLLIDPSFEQARYYVGVATLLGGQQSLGLSQILGCVRRQPRLHLKAHSDMYRGQITFRFRPGDRSKEAPTEKRLMTAFRIVVAMEHGETLEGAGKALALLDALIHEEPGFVMGLTLRGFVLLRLGRLGRAEIDLDLARRGEPRCGVAAFYRLLLWARQGRRTLDLWKELRYANGQGFYTYTQRIWNPHKYPELLRLLGEPGFELLEGKKTGR
jgi:tetratricopeptide (TPR) repeat protein